MRTATPALFASFVLGFVALAVACSSASEEPEPGADRDRASSGSTGSGTSSGDGTSGSGGTSGGPSVALRGYATAICEKVQRCQPGSFAENWANTDACVAEVVASNTEGLTALPGSNVSQDQVNACAKKIAETSCAFGLADIGPCVLKGTLADGAGCYDGRQCQTGRCQRAASTAECGTCGAFAKEGGDCFEDSDCVFGLSCNGGTCAARLAKGRGCNPNASRCELGLVCANGECAEPVEVGGGCSSGGNECRRGLVCEGGECASPSPKVATLGERCDEATTCRQSSCRGTPGNETCVAYVKTGAACGKDRNGPADCVGESNCFAGRCEANTYPSCP